MKKFIGLLGGFAAMLLPFGAGFAQSISLETQNNTAGTPLGLVLADFGANEEVVIDYLNPEAKKGQFVVQMDENGEAKSDIWGKNTQKAGEYSIIASGSAGFAEKDATVKPASVSSIASRVNISPKNATADGKTPIKLTITAKDAYQNPIKGAEVLVRSQNSAIKVSPRQKTDAYGNASVLLTSNKAGKYDLQVYINEKELIERPVVRFTLKADTENPRGSDENGFSIGELLQAQLFGDSLASPDVASFRVEGLDPELPAGEPQNVTVSARDVNDKIVPDYAGTIRFSTEDTEASLPSEYTFTAADLGEHTFFLGVTFGTPGLQSLSVFDTADFRIFGSWEGKVVGDGLGNPPEDDDEEDDEAQTEAEIVLLTPKDGTYKSNRMTITGKCENVESVKLIDKTESQEITLTEGLEVDGECTFIYQTGRLPDGVHVFVGISEQNASVISNEVRVRIDRTPPAAMSVEVQPPGNLCPGKEFSVVLGSSEELSGANCVFSEVETNHENTGENKWAGSYVAPLETGVYSMTCSIYDVSGNVLEQPNAAQIVVNENCGEKEEDNEATIESPNPNDDTDEDDEKNDDEWKDDNDNNVPDSLEDRSDIDTDRDGLTDREENLIGSDPLDSDTDEDCMTDGVEVLFEKTNPLLKNENAFCQNFKKHLLMLPKNLDKEKINDMDEDGVPDWLEKGSDKLNPNNDTDGDGIGNAEDENPLRPKDENEIGDKSCLLAQNLQASPYPGDDTRAWLTWNPPKNCPISIQNYELAFGTDPSNLTRKDLPPAGRDRWYVTELECDTRYFFKLNAKTTNGEMGPGAEANIVLCPKQEVVEMPEENVEVGMNYRQITPYVYGIMTFLGLLMILRPGRRKQD